MFATIGTLSDDTSVPHEIASNLAFELERLYRRDTAAADLARQTQVRLALDAWRTAQANGGDAELTRFYEEVAPELFDLYCAPYTSFQCFGDNDAPRLGIYPQLDSLVEDARDGNGVIQLEAGSPFEGLDDDIDYVMTVNDHGNVSLYDARTSRELWACV